MRALAGDAAYPHVSRTRRGDKRHDQPLIHILCFRVGLCSGCQCCSVLGDQSSARPTSREGSRGSEFGFRRRFMRSCRADQMRRRDRMLRRQIPLWLRR